MEKKLICLYIYLRILFQEIELSVSISNQKCRIRILKAVAKLTGSCTTELHISMINDKGNCAGVDVLKVDAEKGQLTVVGNVDPVAVATAIRKAGYSADITSVGPPKKPDPKPVDDPKKPLQPTPVPDVSRAQCQLVAVTYDTTYEYDSAFCSIL